MSRRGRFVLLGSILVGLPLIALFVYAVAPSTTPVAPRPPELGGQKVPAKLYEIRFDRRYDLFCSFYREEPTVYRNCKILGFTGREEDSAQTGRGPGSGGYSGSSGSASYDAKYFDHWLVLELADGRQAYIPANAVKYIEQASVAGK